jgi:hypothetical protein
MFIAFCTLQSICLGFVWIVLICRWSFHHGMPIISSYPIVDFAMKTARQRSVVNAADQDDPPPVAETMIVLDSSADDSAIRKALKDDYTFVQQSATVCGGSDASLAASTEDDQGLLRVERVYREFELRERSKTMP